MRFAELSALSNFTFLTGASHPEEYIARAVITGTPAVAIADVNSVAGIVRAHAAAADIARRVRERRTWDRTHGPMGPPKPDHLPEERGSFPVYACPRLIPAARLEFTDAPPVIALPCPKAGGAGATSRASCPKGGCGRRRASASSISRTFWIMQAISTCFWCHKRRICLAARAGGGRIWMG